jgi:general secretion pathway protein B
MSLILDALKKSEQQRQREKTPGLQSIHQPAISVEKKSVQSWWPFIAIIVVCNFTFLGYWFWRQQTAVTPTTSNTEPIAAQTTAAPPEKSPQSVPTRDAESTSSQSEFTRISPRETNTQSTSVDASQRIEEINELPDSVRNNLPAMTFSFHVYSQSSEQRTIIINDRRVREGDEIKAGLKLQSITEDGVILLFEGHRIHISVLSGW